MPENKSKTITVPHPENVKGTINVPVADIMPIIDLSQFTYDVNDSQERPDNYYKLYCVRINENERFYFAIKHEDI